MRKHQILGEYEVRDAAGNLTGHVTKAYQSPAGWPGVVGYTPGGDWYGFHVCDDMEPTSQRLHGRFWKTLRECREEMAEDGLIVAKPKPLKRLRHHMVRAPWLQSIAAEARKLDGVFEMILPTHLPSGHQVLHVKGIVEPHNDSNFPEWCYLLVLKSNGAVLKIENKASLRLRPGMLVEFSAHEEHSLLQAEHETVVWFSVDSDDRMTMREALERCQGSFTTPGHHAEIIGFEDEAKAYHIGRKKT